MASWEKTLRADTHGSVNNRPKYQDKSRRRPLTQGILYSSDNLRPEEHTRTHIHEWKTDNTRTRQTVRLEKTPRQSASKIHPKCCKCSGELYDLTTAYAGRCCRKQYLCQRCYYDIAHDTDFFTFRCCNRTLYKQAFQIADLSAEMKPVSPKCDSCDLEIKTVYILPCQHKLCSSCFEEEKFVRSTKHDLPDQFFIGCNKHGSSKRLFAIQQIHTIIFGPNGQYQGLACITCTQRLMEDCFELKCGHYICKNCLRSPHYCSTCRRFQYKNNCKIVKIAGIQQHDILNKEVTVEQESMETTQLSYLKKCTLHGKICVRITCGTNLCTECIESMAERELMVVMTGTNEDEEHCICNCSPVTGKHIISITSLRHAASQIEFIKENRYSFCCQTCEQKAFVIFCECDHAFCEKCVLADESRFSTKNETIFGNQPFQNCGTNGCNTIIPVKQLTAFIREFSTDKATTKRKCDSTTTQSASASASQIGKKVAAYEGDPLKKVTTMIAIERRDDGKCSSEKCISKRTSKEDEKASVGPLIHRETPTTSHVVLIVTGEEFNKPDHMFMTSCSSDVCSGTQDLENPLTKTEERDLKEKQNLKSRDKQSTSETLEDRQTQSMSSSTSVMEEEDVNMLEKTLNEPVDTTPTTTASNISYETGGSDNSPTKVKQKIHCSSPGSFSLCSNIFCWKEAVVQFCDCYHRKCLVCMLKMLSNGKAEKKTFCGVGNNLACATEIPMQSLKEYHEIIRKNPLFYIKEKTSARHCSQTSCRLKERTLAENVKEVCDNPNCSAERFMKEDIRETLSCKHKLCVICVSTQTAKSNVIRCKVPTCTPSEIKPEILGIPNIGFTCYASCVLQVLGQTPGFKDMLSKYCLSSEENHMETLLKKLLENVNVGEESNYVLNWRLMEQLMARIFRIDESFRRYQENDCHSFIMSLLNALMKEKTEKKKHAENGENTIGCDPDSDEETVTKNSRADTMDSCRSKEVVAPQRKKEKSSCPTTLFESRLTSLFTYNDCSHEENVDDQLFYSLLIPVREDVYSLEHGLDVFFNREEFSQGALPCRECNVRREKTITTRSLQMSEAPKILMLQLARFEEVSTVVDGYLKELRKTDHPVKFQMTLRVKRDYTIDKKELEYELYGVVLHRGSMLGGHYTSYVRKQHTNRWFYCSDSTVREIKEERIFQEGIARNAYVLFYSRKT